MTTADVNSPSALVGLLGIFTAAAAQTAYGKVEWNPIYIIGYWSASGSHGGRAASAFGAIGLLIVTLGINISANSISAANDLMAFAPKYINIRRGQLLAAVIGSWAFVPWKILASAPKFLAFLGGYTIFLGPMTSILMTEYVPRAQARYCQARLTPLATILSAAAVSPFQICTTSTAYTATPRGLGQTGAPLPRFVLAWSHLCPASSTTSRTPSPSRQAARTCKSSFVVTFPLIQSRSH